MESQRERHRESQRKRQREINESDFLSVSGRFEPTTQPSRENLE